MVVTRYTYNPYQKIDGMILLYHHGPWPGTRDVTHELRVYHYDDWMDPNYNWGFWFNDFNDALAMAKQLVALPAVLMDICWECYPKHWPMRYPRWNIYRNSAPRPIPPAYIGVGL